MSKLTPKQRLVRALKASNAPNFMVAMAKLGAFDEDESQSATPISDLVNMAEHYGLTEIIEKAERGEFSRGWVEVEDARETWSDGLTDSILREALGLKPIGEDPDA